MMTKIRYASLLLLGFLFLVFVCCPPVLGVWIKHETLETVARLNQSQSNLKLSVSDFHQGWFSSHFEITCVLFPKEIATLSSFQRDNKNPLRVNVTVSHGPLFFLPSPVGSPLPRLEPGIALFKIRNPALSLEGQIFWHLNNLFSMDFASPGAGLTFDGNQLEIKNLHNQATLDPGRHKIQFLLTMNTVSFKSEPNSSDQPFSFVVDGLGISGAVQRIHGVSYGQQRVVAEQVQITSPQNQLKLSGVTYSTSVRSGVSSKQETVSATSQYQIEKLSENASGITQFDFVFDLTDLNAVDFRNLIRALTHNPNRWELASAIVRLIQKGFRFKLQKLFIKTAEGSTTLSGQLQVPKLSGDLSVIEMILKTSFRFELNIPKTELKHRLVSLLQEPGPESLHLLKQDPSLTPEQRANKKITQWEKERWLVSVGDYYKVDVHYHSGRLMLNGKEVWASGSV